MLSESLRQSNGGATTLLNLSYDYAGANGKRTGQLTKILNNLNHNKDRGYSYDALGRLVQAIGGPSTSALWTQTYAYDNYGNRTSVAASGYSARGGTGGSPVNHAQDARATNAGAQRVRGTSPTVREGSTAGTEPGAVATEPITQPSEPNVDLPADLLAKTSIDSLPRGVSPTVREGSEAVSDSTTPLYKPASSPPDGPPTFTNNPLEAGVTTIQALHITELRDAINALRVRAGLATVGWAEAVTSGVTIKADHISEMRTRLDQALAALNLATGGYSAGLATGQEPQKSK